MMTSVLTRTSSEPCSLAGFCCALAFFVCRDSKAAGLVAQLLRLVRCWTVGALFYKLAWVRSGWHGGAGGGCRSKFSAKRVSQFHACSDDACFLTVGVALSCSVLCWPVHCSCVSLIAPRCLLHHSYLYIELHQPYRNDANPTYKGVAIRMMGDLSTCTSTRAVAAYVDADGKPKYLLDTPDATGVALGSRFVDEMRNIEVVLEDWTRSQAVIRVRA